MNEPLTQKQRIIAHLQAYGPLPRADLIEGLPDSKPTVLDAALSVLKAKGLVDRCDKGWFVAEEGAGGSSDEQEPAGAGTQYVPPTTPAHAELPQSSRRQPPPQPKRKPEPAAMIALVFMFHVETKNLRVSITGDDVDALLAIRAVSQALWEHSPVEERGSLQDRGGLDLVS